MNKKGNLFQERLRKDIKKTIAQGMLDEIEKLNKGIQQFAEKTTKSVQEYEK